MKYIKKEELSALIKFDDVFKKTKRAYQLFSQGKTITPPFTVFTIPESKGSVHFKCGYVPGEKYFAMKYSGAFYGNEAKEYQTFWDYLLFSMLKLAKLKLLLTIKAI